MLLFFSLTECRPSDPEPISIVQRTDTLSLARIRALATTAVPSAIQLTDPGLEGIFNADIADHQSPDNTGLTLVTANGVRYKRVFTGPASAGWFGITPTDPDIGPALQTAVNAADHVVIPEGSYTQLTSVHLRSGLTLQGTPGKVTITLPKNYVSLVNPDDPNIPLHDVLIDGLAWEVTSRQDGRYGQIYIDGPSVTNLTVQNCRSNDAAALDSTNWLTLKIQAGKTAKNVVVKNNSVRAKRMACEVFNHDNGDRYAGTDILVSGNDFHDCWFGISLSGPLDGLTVTDNRLKNCSHYGIEVAGAARNVRITNNTFEGTFDIFLEGSTGNPEDGSVVGGMLISGNSTVGRCTGGVQLLNAGAVQFTKNNFRMTGMLELAHATQGGTFTENAIETNFNKAVICDNSPGNTFSDNTISNQPSPGNHATILVYGSKAINNVITRNRVVKGQGGSYYEAVLGGSYRASMNVNEAGTALPNVPGN